MELKVFFTPASIVPAPRDTATISIVIDLIRATTCMAVMLDQGARRIFAAGSVEQARSARERFPTRLLCGERNVKPLPGFDYGNSPVHFTRADLRERELIMTTTNGTRAFHACPPEAIRLAGSLYNAEAVARTALAFALEQRGDIHLVCSGEVDYFGLDDAVCAGYLAQKIQLLAAHHAQSLSIDDSVQAAMALYGAFRPPRVIEYTNAARSVINGGLPEDPSFCMRTSVSQSVALVVGREEETGLLILERAPAIALAE